MFGQPKSGFGSSTFGTTGGGSLFGKTSTSGGLFGNTGGTTGFGSTSTTGGFGGFGSTSAGSGGIFGTPATKSSGGLFGTPSQGFGGSTQSGFGTTSFTQNPSGGLFGSSAPAATTSFGSGGLFGASTSFTNQVSGTGSAKFAPVSGSDTMMKSGIQQSISTKHQCITAMKEYESKSFEELRIDDYLANRKGPSKGAGSAFGAPSTTSGFLFGQKSTAGGLFGSSTAKPAFGTASSGGLFGTTPSSSGGLFGGSKPFGTATSSSSGFGFGSSSSGSSLFGNTSKPAGGVFGGTATSSTGGGLFGNSGSTGFGSAGFGGSGLFSNKPATGFGTTTSTGFGTSGGVSLFGSSAKPTGGLFGGTTGFGQSSAGTSIFGGSNKPAFGTATSTGGGLFGGGSLGTTGTANKGLFGGFGTGTGGNTSFNFNSGSNALGGGTGGFGTSNFGGSLFNPQPASGTGGAVTLPSASNPQSQEMLQALLQAPFGDSPLFKNNMADSAKRQELLKPTNPIAQQAVLQSPIYRISSGNKAKIKPKAHSNLSPSSVGNLGKPHQLFAGLEPEEEADVSNKSFVGRSSVKRLTIKLAPNSGNYPETPRHITPPSTPGERSSASASFKDRVSILEADRSGNITPKDSFQATPVPSGPLEFPPTPSVPMLPMNGESEVQRGSAVASDAASHHSSPRFQQASSATLQSPDSSAKSQEAISVVELEKIRSRPISKLAQESGATSDTGTSLSGTNNTSSMSRGTLVSGQDSSASTANSASDQKISQGQSETVNTATSSSLTTSTVGLKKSLIHESSENLSENEAPHPAGVVLRRRGYYTIPSMDELSSMLDDNQRCLITDFTIGREGYGSVFFPGEVDITDLDIDSIVHIRRKEVTVYPEDDKKPPVGEGLNRPAEITLDCVWPTDKTTRNPVTDLDRLSNMNWSQKIEQITIKMGARFLEYRPETGSWVFEVNHFSKYGLPESDDDDDVVEIDQPLEGSKEENKTAKKATLWSTRAQANRDPAKRHIGLGGEGQYIGDKTSPTAERIQEEEMLESCESQPPVQDLYPLSHKLAREMGVKPDRLQSMKASFFADDDEFQEDLSASVLLGSQTPPKPPSQKFDMRANLLGKQTQKKMLVSDIQRTSSPIATPEKTLPEKPKRLKQTFLDVATKPLPSLQKPNHDADSSRIQRSVLDGASVATKPKLPVMTGPKRNLELLPSSLQIDKEIMLCDAGLFLGRSFRVGWGPGWMLVHSGSSLGQASKPATDSSQFSIFTSAKKTDLKGDFSVNIEVAKCAPHFASVHEDSDVTSDDDEQQYLNLALRDSDFIRSPNSAVPRIEPRLGVGIMTSFAENAQRSWLSVDVTHPDSGFTLACYAVYGLCETLWGLPRSDKNLIDYEEQMRRKQMLISWLVDTIRAESQVNNRCRVNAGDCSKMIFKLVADGRLDEAVQCALQNGNGRLACLLSSSSSTAAESVAVGKQLVEWLDTETDKFINEPTMKLYSLLAAKPTWWLSDRGLIKTCDNLEWKRSLLHHLVFLSQPVSPINDGIQLYKTAWKGQGEFGVYSAAPVPGYVERKRDVINVDMKEDCPARDICYHLLQLYCKRSHRFDTTLCPSSVVPHPLDHRISWLVWRLLYAAGYKKNMKEISSASLHFSYAAQLESRGHWHQAIFVLMHLNNDRKREMAIRNLLGRYVGLSGQPDKESFVTSELGIPEEWLHECRALCAMATGARHQVAVHLLKAGYWQAGHESLMKDVAADCLIHERYEYLTGLLKMFEKAEATAFVKNWENAGKVYLEFLLLTEQIKKLQEDTTTSYQIEEAFENLWPRVTALCQRVADLHCRNAQDRLARAEMAKQTLNLYNVIQLLLKQHELPSSGLSCRGHSGPLPTSVIASQTAKMRLPADYAIQDLTKIVENHFIELVSIRKQSD